MKKIKSFIFLLMIVFLLSGCVKDRTTMTIKNDKSVTYDSEFLISNTLGKQPSSLLDASKYENSGFKVTNIKENNYVGYELTRTFGNIDDLSTTEDTKVIISDFYNDGFDFSKIFKIEKGLFKNTYTADFIYKVDKSRADLEKDEDTELETGEEDEDDLESLSLMSEMEFRYKVNLPNASISNNASEVTNGGKTLSWNLSSSEESEITFKFSLVNTTNIIIVVASGIGVLLLLIIILSIVLKKKKSTKETLIHKEYDPSIAPIIEDSKETPTEVIGEEVPVEGTVSQSDSEMIANLPGPIEMKNLEYTLHEEELVTEQVTIEKSYEEEKPVQEIQEPAFKPKNYNDIPKYVEESFVDNEPKTFMKDMDNLRPPVVETPPTPSVTLDVPEFSELSDTNK